MPSSSEHSATDPDDFRAILRPANKDYLITRSGVFDGRVVKIDLHHLWLQKISDSLPRTWRFDSSRVGLWFGTTDGPPIHWCGAELPDGHLGIETPSKLLSQTTHGASRITALSLAPARLREVGAALTGSEIILPHDSASVAVPAPIRARLKRLHDAAVRLALTTPRAITRGDAAHGLEACLTETFVNCLTAGQLRRETAAQRRHRAIIARLIDLAERHADEPLYLAEVCEAIGVTQRTLTLCCQQKFGVSPKRYLSLRRLHLAHRALRHAFPGTTSVTEIATRYGFWELGRFAVEYKTLFNESPSATLRAQPDRPRPPGANAPVLAGFA